MKRRRILVGLVLSPLMLVGLLAWLHRSDTPEPYFPRYPHAEQHRVYPEKIVSGYTIPAWAEFRTRDSAQTVRTFYLTTLLRDTWILTENTPARMVFLKGLPAGANEELTIRLQQTPLQTTGIIYYRIRLFQPEM